MGLFMSTLYYYHDPMCSWCWGYRPCAEKLFANLPAGLQRVNILGGLAPDSDEPMPLAQQETIAGYWRRIESLLGTPFNHEFWTVCEPRRATYPACRAVIAAGRQGREEEMVLAIQEAYYLEARNPSDEHTLRQLAVELSLDAERFNNDLNANDTEAELQRQVQFARQSPISGLPSLALEQQGKLIPITLDYKNHEISLREIQALL